MRFSWSALRTHKIILCVFVVAVVVFVVDDDCKWLTQYTRESATQKSTTAAAAFVEFLRRPETG